MSKQRKTLQEYLHNRRQQIENAEWVTPYFIGRAGGRIEMINEILSLYFDEEIIESPKVKELNTYVSANKQIAGDDAWCVNCCKWLPRNTWRSDTDALEVEQEGKDNKK